MQTKEELKKYKQEYAKRNAFEIAEKQRQYYIKNKEAILNRVKKYYIDNKEKVQLYSKNYPKKKELNKRYRDKNKESFKKYIAEYRIKNKTKIRDKDRIYWNKRRAIDLQYRLDKNISGSMYKSVKRNPNYSRGHWQKYVGYTVLELVKHIESKFEPWMSWGNYGKWHIDHIKPKSLFNYTSFFDKDFKKCWALENLQPLEAIANIKKKNKYNV